jgi:inosine/xanthosine triphosphate pyrophosphatase family protein
MTRVVFVTPNQGRQAEVQRLLADVRVELSRLGPAVPEGLDLEAAARARAAAAFDQLERPCFVENTAFGIDDEPPLRGAAFKHHVAAVGEDAFCREHAGRRCTVRVVVALAEAPGAEGVRVFAGEVQGVVASAPRGADGYGWDRVLVPDGYERTLAELGASKYLVNMRHAPYLDLADHLRGRSTGGAFEAHVTVTLDAAGDAPRFRAVCDRLGVKCVMIELAEGEHALQPMTASVHRGGLREVKDEVHGLARELVAGGFDVVRTKIEALLRNADIPETDEQAARWPAGYFELHIKVLVSGGDAATLARIAGACEPHGARLSRNANKRRPDGAEERFVTLRVPRLGRVRAGERFAALEADLTALDVPLRARIREFTVYDSNVALDRGWL